MVHKFGLAFTHAPNYHPKFGHETPGFVNLFKHDLWMTWETLSCLDRYPFFKVRAKKSSWQIKYSFYSDHTESINARTQEAVNS